MNKFSLYCWEGYEVREILGKFAESRGLHVESENLTSDSEASSRVILGKAINPSILNINNPFPRKRLFPAKRIHALDRGDLPEWTETILPWTKSLCEWGYSDTGELIGIPQRFGPFNFVINTTLIFSNKAGISPVLKRHQDGAKPDGERPHYAFIGRTLRSLGL